jgi:threonylcarbamoyladenosine tRNA methylthiotransferase MtaB
MERSYSPEEAEEGVKRVYSARDDPFLGCDIITGFPGETQEEFEKTYDFFHWLRLIGIHVFPFSRRPGTEAWDFKNRVTENEAGLRVAKLSALARRNRQAYISRWTEKEVEAIVEDGEDQQPDSIPAISANYLKLLVSLKESNRPKPGSLLRCRIQGIGKEEPGMSKYDARAEVL